MLECNFLREVLYLFIFLLHQLIMHVGEVVYLIGPLSLINLNLILEYLLLSGNVREHEFKEVLHKLPTLLAVDGDLAAYLFDCQV